MLQKFSHLKKVNNIDFDIDMISIFLQDTLIKMRKTKIWKLENDFYNFAAKHFASVKKVVTIDNMIQSSIQINNN